MNRRSASALRRSSRAGGRRCAAATWRSAIPSGRSRRTSASRSNTARGRPSSATTARERRRFCERSSIRSSRSRAKFAGATAARSASTPSTSTPACRRSRPCSNIWKTAPPAARRSRRFSNGAASLLFRGPDVKKKISVLSGGERARLCLAGLLLSQYNVLILDEPGNHLDVDTVDALAEALLAYKGTVIFTSHDRHFMKRVATSIIEVRDGRVVNYRGDYEAYLYAVNKEIEEGERETATRMAKPPTEVLKVKTRGQAPPAQRTRASQRDLQRRTNDRETRRAEESSRTLSSCRRPTRKKRCGCTTSSRNWRSSSMSPKNAGAHCPKNWASSSDLSKILVPA